MRVSKFILPSLGALVLAGAPSAVAAAGGGASLSVASKKHARSHHSTRQANSAGPAEAGSGGASLAMVTPSSTPTHPMVAGSVAKIIHGVAYAPAGAPIQVQQAIWAGNKIRHTQYVYGGGHGSFNDAGYDCSGTVSYVLHAAGLLSVPMDSSEFMGWGRGGLGQWITVFTNPGHAFIEIAGIRMDTSSNGDPSGHSGSGPRWRRLLRDTSSYDARHPGSL